MAFRPTPGDTTEIKHETNGNRDQSFTGSVVVYEPRKLPIKREIVFVGEVRWRMISLFCSLAWAFFWGKLISEQAIMALLWQAAGMAKTY